MEINLKYTNIEPAEDIKNYVQKRILPLAKFLPESTETHAWVEVSRITRHHQEGKIWYAECQIEMPGKPTFRAASTKETLFAAIDEARDNLEHILHNAKEKQKDNLKRPASLTGAPGRRKNNSQ